jgi:cyclopropane fatty-acyl-phospholipid synthase-like methyltransferase
VGPALRACHHLGYWTGPADGSSVEEATDRFTDVLVEKLAVGPGDRVLDVGCGIGKPAVRLARATGCSVVGISVNRAHAAAAGERAEEEGVGDRVSFEYGDGMALAFGDGEFDAVLAFESILYMDRARALREMSRVLRPGGQLVFTDLFLSGASPATAAAAKASRQLPALKDYLSLVTTAGLRLTGLDDVSDRTRSSFGRMREAITTHRAELEREGDPQVTRLIDEMIASLGDQGRYLGCCVVSATRVV